MATTTTTTTTTSAEISAAGGNASGEVAAATIDRLHGGCQHQHGHGRAPFVRFAFKRALQELDAPKRHGLPDMVLERTKLAAANAEIGATHAIPFMISPSLLAGSDSPSEGEGEGEARGAKAESSKVKGRERPPAACEATC